jgi:hypothetical protein
MRHSSKARAAFVICRTIGELGELFVHSLDRCRYRWKPIKKADVTENPEGFDHVGLLANEPPNSAGLLFI